MSTDELESLMARRCWAEIDFDALRHNAAMARELAGPEGAIMGVVKADGYGHGLEDVAAALDGRVEFFGVANVAEALRLRRAGIAGGRVFVLGAALEWERPVVVENGFVPALCSVEDAAAYDLLAAANGRRLRAHLALDTGMGRIGFRNADEIARHWRDWAHLDIDGMATHLPSADEDPAATREQLARFAERVECLRAAGLDFRHVHAANSAGLLGFAAGPCTLFRPGLMLYGVAPMAEWQPRLRPALAWKSRVTQVRDLPPGIGVSYGGDFVTAREPFTRVATLAVGYGDGYPRRISGRGAEVAIHGIRCAVLGRVTMDQTMVDVTALGDAVRPGDVAVLVGDGIAVAELAAKAGTIPWEILTGITRRVARVRV